MQDRREFLKSGALLGAGFVLSGHSFASPIGAEQIPLSPSALRKFVDPLPRPAVLTPERFHRGMPFYRVTATEFTQTLHSDLPATTVWGYAGTFPGPTIEARKNEPLVVAWENALGTGPHLLPVDRTLHGTSMGEPDRRIVTHLHGGIVPPAADGWPEAWFASGQSAEFLYPNSQRGTTLWYHDHAIGITRLNVQAGLAAFYLLRDEEEDALVQQGLPSGSYEIPIVMQDRSFYTDGSLAYPTMGVTTTHPVWMPEFFGDVSVVNGVAWPVLDVEPRMYRLRLLNGCNSRFLNLQTFAYRNGRYLQNGPVFVMIGSDGGLLPGPVVVGSDMKIPRRLLLAPAERADVLIDFSAFAGQDIVLHNNAPTPFSGFAQGNARPPATRPGHPIGANLPEIMMFRVANSTPSPGVLPPLLSPSFQRIDPNDAVVQRYITLEEVLDPAGVPLEALIDGRHWNDEWTEQRAFGTTEIWHFVNLTADSHPIHLHLDHFQILWRRPFDATRWTRGSLPRYRGPEIAPPPEEMGWKDTVVAHPGEVTAIAIRSDSFRGTYPYHCHILEHEDNEMMRAFQVL